MGFINVKLDDRVESLEYKIQDEVYVFSKAISVSKWMVEPYIKLGGPKSSIYKHDFKNYFEFVITDANGIQDVLRWYYNNGDKYLMAMWTENGAIEALPFFLGNHPIFKTENWDDFRYCDAITDIRKIVEQENMSCMQKFSEISQIINNRF